MKRNERNGMGKWIKIQFSSEKTSSQPAEIEFSFLRFSRVEPLYLSLSFTLSFCWQGVTRAQCFQHTMASPVEFLYFTPFNINSAPLPGPKPEGEREMANEN
jgi:hypothetical protein